MKLLKLCIFGIILLNLAAAGVAFYGFTVGGIANALSFGLLLLFFFIKIKKVSKPNFWLLTIGFLYYFFSSFNYLGTDDYFILASVKYFVIVFCGYELVKRITKNELFYFLFVGSISIGIHAMFFPSNFGRYSGLYLNPNLAGFICIFCYSLIFGIKTQKLRLLSQFIVSLMGFLTFSRTFIVLWILLNLISIKISIKNIRVFAIGLGIFFTLIVIDESVGLKNPRFQQLRALASNEKVSTSELNEDSRVDTWARFYDQILENPIFGNGYGTFQGITSSSQIGSHNTYLLVLGESGFVPFLLFITFIAYLLIRSFKVFKQEPHLFLLMICLSMFLLTNHNFFNFYYITFLTMWTQFEIDKAQAVLKQEGK
ncbi:O-antigen ligase [Flagellimonas sp. S3867]|uniref:O-antigen ligase family protein n=1 Tax=Flagellimonas sp. S3867 TaxID=2768063 RepID=UPI001686CCA3|nr:O-antigen ligase family protein [Flagellimonas sp. S3867]